MTRPRFCLLVLVILPFVGCSKRPDNAVRPVAGDTVTVELQCPATWQAGGPVIVGSQLRVQNASEIEPVFLRHEDVPLEFTPYVTVTFWQGNAMLEAFEDVAMAPDC